MHSIKAIRNAFAHSKLPESFNTKEVSDELDAVFIPYANQIYEVLFDKKPDETLSSKQAFLVGIKMTCFILDEHHQDLTGQPLFAPLEAVV